jgi:transcription elongation factor Elf1
MDRMPTYFECKNCGQIESESRWLKDGERSKCVYCEIGEPSPWPTAEVKELIDFVQGYDPKSSHYFRVTTVFLASALELMLEDLLYTMAWMDMTYDEVSILVEALIESHQGRSRMFDLYRRIGHDSFHKEVRNLSYKQFLDHWENVVSARNHFVHGKSDVVQEITGSLIEMTIVEALEVFSALHNEYNVESLHYKVGMEQAARRIEFSRGKKRNENTHDPK